MFQGLCATAIELSKSSMVLFKYLWYLSYFGEVSQKNIYSTAIRLFLRLGSRIPCYNFQQLCKVFLFFICLMCRGVVNHSFYKLKLKFMFFCLFLFYLYPLQEKRGAGKSTFCMQISHDSNCYNLSLWTPSLNFNLFFIFPDQQELWVGDATIPSQQFKHYL